MGQLNAQKYHKQIDYASFNYPQLMSTLNEKKILNFQQIKHKCNKIGQGWGANVYLYSQKNIVLKIMKGHPNYGSIIQQAVLLQKVNTIWPGIFEHMVFDDSKLIGFSMKFFDGKKIWQAFTQPGNILRNSKPSRVRLVKKLKQVIKKLQQLKIGHGDLHIDNIMIKQPDKTKQEYQLLIIDYGLSFIIDDWFPQKPNLTGWSFMKPPETKKSMFYNAQGLNPYMFGRVALQILTLQTYDDYSHRRDDEPIFQLQRLKQMGFDISVNKQIQLLLHHDIKIRAQQLMRPSIMKQQVKQEIKSNNQLFKDYNSIFPSLGQLGCQYISSIRKQQYENSYYVRHPQKLGYQF